MAEAHPVGFRWVMKAKERGARIIHVDPRYSRTSALADHHVPDPRGDRHRVPRRPDPPRARDGVVLPANTSSTTRTRRRSSTSDFADVEDLGGVFSGFDPETGMYDRSSVDVRGRRDGLGGGRARARDPGVRGEDGRRHARRRGAARRHARRTRAACSRSCAGTSPLHARDGRAHLRHLRGGLPRGRRGADRELRPRAHDGASATPWGGRSTPSACR